MLSSCRGLINRVIDSGRNVIVDLPKGGSIRAPNMGAFEIGDEVCFTLDAAGRKVVLIMPKEMAEWHDAKVENEMIQISLQQEDQCDGSILFNDDPDYGQAIEIVADCSGRKSGEVDFGGEDNFLDEYLHEDGNGIGGESGVSPEGPVEADPFPVQVPLGHGWLEEMGDGPSESVDAGGASFPDSEGD